MYIFQKIGIKFTVDGFFENQPMPGMAYFSRTNAIISLMLALLPCKSIPILKIFPARLMTKRIDAPSIRMLAAISYAGTSVREILIIVMTGAV